uniref:Uncharacterized protein n=1 Tax=Arundo donax TaxID=35708 RepID=A0A0A9DUR4_ARUDO
MARRGLTEGLISSWLARTSGRSVLKHELFQIAGKQVHFTGKQFFGQLKRFII